MKIASIKNITSFLNKTLRVRSIKDSSVCCVLGFGEKSIRSIGIVSGGGGSILTDVVKEQLDCFPVETVFVEDVKDV